MSNYNELIKLKNKLDKLSREETIEIFKIVHKNTDKYTQNQNGIFLDLTNLDEHSFVEIKAFIDFIEENKKHINKIEAKIKENKINIDNKYCDRNTQKNTNEFQTIICTDYSPFVTDLDDNFLDEIVTETDIVNTSVNNIIIEDLEDFIEDDLLLEEEDEEDVQSSSITNQKKKKNVGIRYRILKKCKNINNQGCEGDDIDKDIYDELDVKELLLEKEYSEIVL